MKRILPTERELRSVLVIGVGGTICSRPSIDGLVSSSGMSGFLKSHPRFNDGSHIVHRVLVGEDGIQDIAPSLVTMRSVEYGQVRFAVLELQQLQDSSCMDAKDWNKIARLIDANYHLFDGFAISHGTDCLTYTSSALSFILEHLGKPVILTGSQLPFHEVQSDGIDNLLGAISIAGQYCIPEVCLFFGRTLFRGNRATKISAYQPAAFASPNLEPLAVVTSSGVKVRWDLIRPHDQTKRLKVNVELNSGHVACLRCFPGMQPELVSSIARQENLRGLVLETFGTGNILLGVNNSILHALSQAINAGLVVVNVTQCELLPWPALWLNTA
jgi:lysophospholipase